MGLPLFLRVSASIVLSWRSLLPLLAGAIVSSIVAGLIFMESLKEAVAAVSVFRPIMSSQLVSGQGEVYSLGGLTPDIELAGRVSGFLPGIIAGKFWALIIVYSLVIPAALHSFLTRVYSQPPSIMYRARVTPGRLLAYALATSTIIVLPLTTTPLVVTAVVVAWASLPVEPGEWTPLGLMTLYPLVFMPLLYSTTYLVTGRLDASLLLLLVFSGAFYLLASLLGLLGALGGLAASLFYTLSLYYVGVSRRWL